MTEKFLSAIKRYGMLQAGETVTVALSGGADSVALLHLLYTQREKLGIKIKAAHLNHNLRGEESLRDERFAIDFCGSLNIPISVKSVDVAALSAETGESIELAARSARYAFFSELGGKIATAHTATDNAETVLINLSRGTALKGICGIPAKRDMFIRPLKFCTRADVEKYCEENKLSFVTDSTNLGEQYTRNKIRHNVVPGLRAINPSFDDAVTRFCLAAETDSDFLSGLAKTEFDKCFIDKKIVIDPDMHKAIATRVIAIYLEKIFGKTADFLHINEIYDSLGNKTEISFSGSSVLVDGYTVSITETEKCVNFSLTTTTVSKEKFDLMLKVNKLLLKNAIDYDKISVAVTIRTRAEGDSIKLVGRGTKSLKKLYNEEKIPQNVRASLPVAADNCGVVWVHGIGASSRVRVDKSTKNVLIFNCEEL